MALLENQFQLNSSNYDKIINKQDLTEIIFKLQKENFNFKPEEIKDYEIQDIIIKFIFHKNADTKKQVEIVLLVTYLGKTYGFRSEEIITSGSFNFFTDSDWINDINRQVDNYRDFYNNLKNTELIINSNKVYNFTSQFMNRIITNQGEDETNQSILKESDMFFKNKTLTFIFHKPEISGGTRKPRKKSKKKSRKNKKRKFSRRTKQKK